MLAPAFRVVRVAACLALVGAAFVLSSCSDPASQPPTNVMFWSDESISGDIVVSFEGSQIGTITIHYATEPAGCYAAGAVTAVRGPGTYSYSATGANSAVWDGTVTLVQGECAKVNLYR